jgi:hypothetical protein
VLALSPLELAKSRINLRYSESIPPVLFVWAKQNSILVDLLGWSSNFVSLKMHVTEESIEISASEVPMVKSYDNM